MLIGTLTYTASARSEAPNKARSALHRTLTGAIAARGSECARPRAKPGGKQDNARPRENTGLAAPGDGAASEVSFAQELIALTSCRPGYRIPPWCWHRFQLRGPRIRGCFWWLTLGGCLRLWGRRRCCFSFAGQPSYFSSTRTTVSGNWVAKTTRGGTANGDGATAVITTNTASVIGAPTFPLPQAGHSEQSNGHLVGDIPQSNYRSRANGIGQFGWVVSG